MHATRFVGLARVHEPHVMAEHPVIATGVDRLTRNASPHTGGELVHDDAMVRASTTKPCSIGIEYASDGNGFLCKDSTATTHQIPLRLCTNSTKILCR
ncbi:hypothetical protein BHE74_00033046 [Ensete ventricosum]|nr:hypothetical protein BHE74_00033046 [Ensete ventricosum]RZS10066.1 hypothetical protein BHM03_00041226 [Ensete ventricosum]